MDTTGGGGEDFGENTQRVDSDLPLTRHKEMRDFLNNVKRKACLHQTFEQCAKKNMFTQTFEKCAWNLSNSFLLKH